MEKVPYLAAHLEKRSGKEESFGIIKKAIKGEILKEHDWAVLYSYFLPPSPKKITNPFEWVSMVCDKNESYAFCKYILVEDKKIMAANTRAAHILFNNLGLTDSWYDIKKGNVGDDVAIMPNIDQVLNESSGHHFSMNFINGESFDIVEAPTGLSYVLPWNDKGVDKNYFDLMIKSLDNISIQYSEDGAFNVRGTVNGIECVAVIMPFKLNGFALKKESNSEQLKNLEHEQLTF